MAKNSYFYALGRRKTATARVRLTSGTGIITVNNISSEEYFNSSKYLLSKLNQPFSLLDKVNKFNVSAVVFGGGLEGQIEAIRLAIAKALILVNEDYKASLKRADLLSRDSRQKERKKFGLKSARKKRQFTKR